MLQSCNVIFLSGFLTFRTSYQSFSMCILAPFSFLFFSLSWVCFSSLFRASSIRSASSFDILLGCCCWSLLSFLSGLFLSWSFLSSFLSWFLFWFLLSLFLSFFLSSLLSFLSSLLFLLFLLFLLSLFCFCRSLSFSWA